MHRLLLLGLVATVAAVAAEPANLGLHKREIRAYVDSGEYARDIAAVAARADAWVRERSARRGAGERLTLVCDLDETLLSNLPEMQSLDFGYAPVLWREWVAKGEAPPIEPVRAVYRVARELGIDVVFLTGRPERDRAGTEKNLRAIGCADYAALIMEPDDARGPVAEFKRAQRAKLAAEGRVVIANLGDQASDFAGGGAERDFKLPDPFYLSE
jgi:acid phosphatase